MTKLNTKEFNTLCKATFAEQLSQPYLRLGQCFFNTLHETHPDLANSVRGTINDPFYNSNKLKEFFIAIVSEDTIKEMDLENMPNLK